MNGYCEAITWRGSRCSRKARTRGLCRRHKAIQESGRDVYTADDVRAEPEYHYWMRKYLETQALLAVEEQQDPEPQLVAA